MNGAERVQFRADARPMYLSRGVDIRIVLPEERRIVSRADFTIEDVEPYHEIPVAMQLDDREARQLMDALWEAGVRPTNGEGSTGKLSATERHLEDMRRLVFRGES